MDKDQLPVLPCYPCPHQASCCAYGTTVTDAEAAAIEAALGPGRVYRLKSGEWRTRVEKSRCVLYVDGGCQIHGQPFYPQVCRGFPWKDAETGGPYEFDRTICGEFVARPELLDVYPFRGHADSVGAGGPAAKADRSPEEE